MKKEQFVAMVQEFLVYIQHSLQRSTHTQRAYKADLENFLHFWGEQEIQSLESLQDLVNRYFIQLSKHQKDKKTIARKSSCFSSLNKFILCVKQQEFKLVTPRPAIINPNPHGIDAAVLTKLLEKKNEQLPTKFPLRDKAIVELLYATGIRCSELVQLRINDLDLVNRTLKIFSKRTQRIVFFGTHAQQSIHRYITTERLAIESPVEKLFLNYQNRALTTRSIQRICTMFLPTLTPAVLRHSCALHLIQQGANPEMVQELLGFTTAISMEKYCAQVRVKSK